MNDLSQRLVRSISALVLALTFTACYANPEKPPSRVEAAFDSFDRFQDGVVRSDPSTRRVASLIHERYRSLFSPYQTNAMVAKLGPNDVALLFRAADLDFFYTVSRGALDDMLLDLAELHRRGVARKANDEKVYRIVRESPF